MTHDTEEFPIFFKENLINKTIYFNPPAFSNSVKYEEFSFLCGGFYVTFFLNIMPSFEYNRFDEYRNPLQVMDEHFQYSKYSFYVNNYKLRDVTFTLSEGKEKFIELFLVEDVSKTEIDEEFADRLLVKIRVRSKCLIIQQKQRKQNNEK